MSENVYLCEPATVAETANRYYGGDLTPDSGQVQEACARATAKFRSAIRHHLTEQTGLRLVLDGTGTRYLRLPVLEPVIRSVTVRGALTEPVGVSPYGLLEFSSPLPPTLGAVVVELERCGLEHVPEEVSAAVMVEAVMALGRTPGVQSETVGAVSVSYGATGVVGVREQWQEAVENYRIRVGDRA